MDSVEPLIKSSNENELRTTNTLAASDWSNVLVELETKENDLLENYVREQKIDLLRETDEKGFSMLHYAVLKCIPGKVLKVINLAQNEQGADLEAIREWVN